MESLLKPKEVAQIIGCCHSIVVRLLAKGEIPSIIVGCGTQRRSFRVRPSDLEKWLKSREVRNTRPACPASAIPNHAAL